MDGAEADAEVLLLEHDGHVLEDAVCQLPQVVLALRDTLELHVGVNIAKAVGGLEFLGASLLHQVAEHQIHLELVLRIGEGAVGLKVKFHSKVAKVIELNLLFLVADHEAAGVEAELFVVEL